MNEFTYAQLKTKTKDFLWEYGIKTKSINEYAQSLGCWYYAKSTILEILSVTHREWDIKKK